MFIRKFILFALLGFLPLSISLAQSKTEASDPKAKALLEKVKKLYESYESIESSFTLSLKMAEQAKEEVQKGKICQQGEKYRVDMGKQTVWGDAKIIWLKVDNTVQIMNSSGKNTSQMMSMKDLMSIYEKKDYVYTIMGESTEGWSKKATLITFKPTNRKGDYTQIRVAIDQKTNQVVSITTFGKDQSRYKLSIEQPTTNKKYAADFFTFDKSKFPNAKIEDLRVD